MKHFMDIDNLRESDIDLGGDAIRRNNCGAFVVGDRIIIQEKVDGSNASFKYNPETGKIDCFSRKKELDFQNTLRGFWNIIQELSPEEYKNEPTHIYFGEMLVKHIVKYEDDAYNKFYVFDIYDTDKEVYLPQDEVKELAKFHGLNYINNLYDGEFISWDHCRTFLHSPHYGDAQEGIVVKNQSKLTSTNCRDPFYLKIVNDEFKETMNRKQNRANNKKKNSEEYDKMVDLLSGVVTKERVVKELHKMIDEDLLPPELTPQHMKMIAQMLPKRIFDDCMKEEPETMIVAGEYAGKICSNLTMKYARKAVIG